MIHAAGPLNMPPAEPGTTITIQTHTAMRDVVYFNTLGMPALPLWCIPFIFILLIVHNVTGAWSVLTSLAWLALIIVTTTSLGCVYSYFKKGILGVQTITITPEFIRETSEHDDERYDWSKVAWVFRNKKYIAVIATSSRMIPIYRKDFHSQQEFNQASELIRTYWKAGQNKVNLLK